MVHTSRSFRRASIASAAELAEKLADGRTWTLCTGFQIGPLLFLNDSFSEDGAQEYAVFAGGDQVESLTVSWMSVAEAERAIAALLAGLAPVEESAVAASTATLLTQLGGAPRAAYSAVAPRLDHPGSCHLCA